MKKYHNPWAGIDSKRGSPFVFGFKSFLAVFICFLAVSAAPLFAQSAAAPAVAAPVVPGPAIAAQENRYLLIVDTSKSVRDRALGALNAVAELLASGMNGQIREGDTIALWTFDDQLYAGRFPIQHWSAADQGGIITRVLTFLRDQKVGKLSKLDNVMLAMGYVVQGSQCATVILITDGEHKIRGTPFDDQINNYCARFDKKQRKAKMPFAIVLRSLKGNITEYAVSAPPSAILVPQVPPLTPPMPAPAQLAKAVASESPVPPLEIKKLPPGALVFSGASPKPLVPPAPPEPPPAKVETVAKVEAPAPVAPPDTTPKANAATPSSNNGTAQSPVAPANRPIVAPSVALADPPENSSVLPVQPTLFLTEPVKKETALPASAPPATAPSAPPVVTIPPAAPVSVAKVEAVKPSESNTVAAPEPAPVALVAVAPAPKPAPKTVVSDAPKPVAVAEVRTIAVAAPPTVSTVGAVPVAAIIAPNAHAGELHPAKARPHPHVSGTPGYSQVGMAVPAVRLVDRWMFWAAACLLAATAISCSVLIGRRTRTAPSASLITCSFDRNKRG